MSKFILLVIIITTLNGCTTTHWEHSTKKPTSSYLDLLHCRQDAKKAAEKSGYSHDKLLIKNETDNCMNEKYGWTKEKQLPFRYYLPFPFNLLIADK